MKYSGTLDLSKIAYPYLLNPLEFLDVLNVVLPLDLKVKIISATDKFLPHSIVKLDGNPYLVIDSRNKLYVFDLSGIHELRLP